MIKTNKKTIKVKEVYGPFQESDSLNREDLGNMYKKLMIKALKFLKSYSQSKK